MILLPEVVNKNNFLSPPAQSTGGEGQGEEGIHDSFHDEAGWLDIQRGSRAFARDDNYTVVPRFSRGTHSAFTSQVAYFHDAMTAFILSNAVW